MRLASLATPKGRRLHKLIPSGYVDIATVIGDESLSTLRGYLQANEDAKQLVAAIEIGEPADDVILASPIDNPPKILCMGRNYRAHVEETNNLPTDWPDVFIRANRTIAGPFEDLVLPLGEVRFDYEGELGIIIGVGGRRIEADRAMEHVAGFVVLNDISARDWQHRGSQWTPGKNFDHTLPMGPEMVTADEVLHSHLGIETRLNGSVMQSAPTELMLLDVPGQIEFFSSFLTLEPGDVLATGTPGGVGFSRRPPVYLAAGDVIEVEIEGIGTIRNTISADELHGTRSPSQRWSNLARSKS